MEEGFGGDYTAHAVADENGADAGIYRRGKSAGRDFEVDDDVLEPAMRMSMRPRQVLTV